MTKAEFIKAIADKTGGRITAISGALQAITEVVQEQLSAGNDVVIPGVGKLVLVQKAERQGRNPRTGETKTIPAKNALKFKAAASLKDAIQ